MKVLHLFLATLVLGLSLIPCCDAQLNVNAVSSQLLSTKDCSDKCCGSNTQKSSESQDESCDICSPFFSCGHCSGCTTSDLSLLLDWNSFLNKDFAQLELVFPNEFLINKWHPPKIG